VTKVVEQLAGGVVHPEHAAHSTMSQAIWVLQLRQLQPTLVLQEVAIPPLPDDRGPMTSGVHAM
jgi:hypothetical protein